ncbi:MAG: ribosomal RNA small subunit methyltransferase A [Desulfobacula sp.]|jgi:16S rRNA (adenine1518-N6/adenine1519-N6)-dimethyltransferase|nr:ribosomal RNA small subunit methyltransferase A [Desulfobacula sp.]MBT6338541.1 ribosomal RNA small subunit methyltransferase A [Desulfobacula sp.]MBT7259716.1 ribosomal RNA small subunit methyltransferase A [Desulfobacula sp.]
MTHPGQLLKEKNLFAGKEKGQNFLANPGTAKMIIEKIGLSPDTHVLEIGPGLGALTIPIARAALHVTAVETDVRLIPLLKQELDNENLKNVTIIHKNILKVDITDLSCDKKFVVIGNLPYNISSQILIKLVEERRCIETAFLMFQKELAKRIIAKPGKRDYSRLSAVVQYAADVSQVAQIGPSSFFPKPDVDSTILKFNFFEPGEMNFEQEKILFNVIKAAFSKRRKSLKNAMTGGEFEFEKNFITQALESAGIDAIRRAETLTVEEFKSLAMAVWEKTGTR